MNDYKHLIPPSMRQHLRILPIASGILIAIIMAVQFIVSYNRESNYVDIRMEHALSIAQHKALFELYDMYEGVNELEDRVLQNIDSPEKIEGVIYDIAKQYEYLSSCYVAFSPNFFSSKGYWYEPCSYHIGDSIINIVFNSSDHDYFQSSWYKGALASDDMGYWSQAYHDAELNTMICTHSIKFSHNGKIIGVAGMDFNISWAEQLLQDAKPYDEAICLLYCTDGSLLCHSGNPDFDEDDYVVASSMLSPVEMRLVLAVPKSQILGNVRSLNLITFIILVIGITLLGTLIRRYLHNQTKYNRVESEKRLMEQEMQIAHQIQMDILRHDFPDNPQVRLTAHLLPMREVGGDLYDFYMYEDRLFFIIGDVSGKGIPAAMFMSATVNLFRSAVRRLDSTKQIMEEINNVLSENNPSLTFVTAFIGKLNLTTGTMSYCNAGHLPPIIVEKGETRVERVVSNIPLGYKSDYSFVEQGMLPEQNALLVLYTDGITEARNTDNKMLGKQRWLEIVGQSSNDTQTMLRSVLNYTVRAEQTDDITLLGIRIKNEPQPLVCSIPSKIESWHIVKNPLMEMCLCAGFNLSTIRKIVLAVEETIVNIINYAYPSEQGEIEIRVDSVELRGERGESCLTITITDSGIAFDPTAVPDVNTAAAAANRQVGGLGIMLVRQIMDNIYYERKEDKNILKLIKYQTI